MGFTKYDKASETNTYDIKDLKKHRFIEVDNKVLVCEYTGDECMILTLQERVTNKKYVSIRIIKEGIYYKVNSYCSNYEDLLSNLVYLKERSIL